jgi:hypothetical protein
MCAPVFRSFQLYGPGEVEPIRWGTSFGQYDVVFRVRPARKNVNVVNDNRSTTTIVQYESPEWHYIFCPLRHRRCRRHGLLFPRWKGAHVPMTCRLAPLTTYSPAEFGVMFFVRIFFSFLSPLTPRLLRTKQPNRNKTGLLFILIFHSLQFILLSFPYIMATRGVIVLQVNIVHKQEMNKFY